MIGLLQGQPIWGEQDEFILMVQGVGYELHCAQSTLDELQGKSIVKLWVHTHVREDAITLYGFSEPLEKQVFLSLLKVNGIGPKSALNILSASRWDKLLDLIENGNAAALSKLPKVGKKTAEQIILTLQGKLVRASQSTVSERSLVEGQIITALVNLGFRLQEVEKVVEQLDESVDVQEGLRRSLAALTN